MSRDPALFVGRIRVLVAGRSPAARRRIRQSLTTMDTVHFAGEATTGRGMIRAARRTVPGVIVIRSTLGRRELLPELSRIRSERPDVQIVAVSRSQPKIFLRVARRYGVSFCVPESLIDRRLPSLVRLAHRDYREASAKLCSIGRRPSSWRCLPLPFPGQKRSRCRPKDRGRCFTT